MTTHTNILELPLHLVGISDQVSDWLRQAGFPVMQLGQDSALKSAFRLKRRPAEPSPATPMRCLLFDSRDLWSRAVVKSYQNQSCFKVDVASLLVPILKENRKISADAEIPNPIRQAFLEELKKTIESQGGVWARLADLPFPYQGVGCLNSEPSKPTRKRGPKPEESHRPEMIQQRYFAGLPSRISTADLSRLAELRPVTGLESPGLPLLWRAEPAEFSQWWQHRNHLEVKLWQSPTQYRIECRKTNSSFCPVLEIWRGNHLACVPLRSESIVVQKEGLVFQLQPTRHPAGFTAGWPDSASDAQSSCLLA